MTENIVGEVFSYNQETFKCFRVKPISEKIAIYTDKRTLVLLPSQFSTIFFPSKPSVQAIFKVTKEEVLIRAQEKESRKRTFWSAEEDALLLNRKLQQLTVREVAAMLDRDANSIRVRTCLLKKRLLCPIQN